MANTRKTYVNPDIVGRREARIPSVLRAKASEDNSFKVEEKILNTVNAGGDNVVKFPGNISPEGYFYSPFYEVSLKELDDEPQFVTTRRINFMPSGSSVIESSVTFYSPEMGIFIDKPVFIVAITSPVPYDFINGQPFCIYDILEENTLRGYLDQFIENDYGGYDLHILTESEVVSEDLDGSSSSGKSRYIISMADNNAPDYAEYIPSSGKLVWRAPKKMSELESTSALYNMPFSNGRLYIHKNLNVFVRRQDPHNDFSLFRPNANNPLRRFQVEGEMKIDFDYLKQIIDSMVDAC